MGGPEAGAGNVISGNGGIGGPQRNGVVQGNFIGTDVTGTLALGNGSGVAVSGNVMLTQNMIEFNADFGVDALAGGNLITNNTIAFNGTINTLAFNSAGVIATGGNLISQNSIFSNVGPDLGLGGYLNDPSPDADGIQNYPILDSVAAAGAGTQVKGCSTASPARTSAWSSSPTPSATRTLRSAMHMPGEFGGGRTFLGTIDVTTDANGHASFTADLPALPAGQPFVTATATDITDTGSGPLNNTSGFSPVAVLGGPSFVVTNTGDTGLGDAARGDLSTPTSRPARRRSPSPSPPPTRATSTTATTASPGQVTPGGHRRHDRDQTTRTSPTSTPTGRTVGSRSCPSHDLPQIVEHGHHRRLLPARQPPRTRCPRSGP